MTSAELDRVDLAAALRAEHAARRAEVVACIPDNAVGEAALELVGSALARRNSDMFDGLLTSLYRGVLARANSSDARAWDRVAMAGVGSYGRGLLSLGSDVDLRIAGPNVAEAGRLAEVLLYPLWDVGVSVGHQVVSIADAVDAAREDLPTATSLLDWRHLAGDASSANELAARLATGIFAHGELPRFMSRLRNEVEQRHARFGGSVYLLEPDVKNGAGGLRDLDVARWAARARWGASELYELVRVGALLPREAAELNAASELLIGFRNLLHAHANRRSDRLTFDEQEAIASLLGYGSGDDAVEHLMSAYYRSARTISRALDMILTRATPLLSRRKPHEEDLGGGVRMFDGCVTLADPSGLRVDPALALRLVATAIDRGAPLLPYARDAVARASADRAWCEELSANAEAAAMFRALVGTCKEVKLHRGTVARELHDLGLLLAMIPEFSPVVGRVHHDIYHVYTVDVHSVAAVDRLAALMRGELAEAHPLATRLAAEVSRPEMLFFATLLHDVGKAIGGVDHSVRGAEMARPILMRLGLSPSDVDAACSLVREHLVMYHVATRRDLDDPATIAEFSTHVAGREGLRELYLLTVVDLATTSPTSMTSWKARMLDQLYLEAERALAGDARDEGRLQEAKREVSQALDALPVASDGERAERVRYAAAYLASMPERYVLVNGAAAVAAHAELARQHEVGSADVSVALVPSRHPEAAELCVVTGDRPGLLAAITAALAASRLEVHAAQIHSRTAENGLVQAVDLFWVRDRGDGVEGVARAVPKLVRDIRALFCGEVDAKELARKRAVASYAMRGPRVATQVVVDDRVSERHTVIEVTTRDRPGLLFAISDALYRLGLTIAVAKINTEGTRVADVFYVVEADGAKVKHGQRANEVQSRLVSVLAELEARGTDG